LYRVYAIAPLFAAVGILNADVQNGTEEAIPHKIVAK
jgi:hypothetical protein